MIQEGEFVVQVTLTNTIQFSPIERAGPLVEQDAIENAKGTVQDSVWKALEDEGWHLTARVIELHVKDA